MQQKIMILKNERKYNTHYHTIQNQLYFADSAHLEMWIFVNWSEILTPSFVCYNGDKSLCQFLETQSM